MLLRFVGQDEKLKHGIEYNVNIYTREEFIVVTIPYKYFVCPYESPQSFAADWEKPNRKKVI